MPPSKPISPPQGESHAPVAPAARYPLLYRTPREPAISDAVEVVNTEGSTPAGGRYGVTFTHIAIPSAKCGRTLQMTRYVPGSPNATDSTRF